jgi:hypothetical protein
MKKNLIITSAILLSMLVYACGKKQDKAIDLRSIYACHVFQNLDSAKIATKLVGSWKLIKKASIEGPEKIRCDVQVVFNQSGTFLVMENLAPHASGMWNVRQIDSNYFELNLSESSGYVGGIVQCCNNQILFHGSHYDAADYLFEKAD